MKALRHHVFESYLAKPIFYLFLVVCLLYFRIDPVSAHRVIVFAWVEGDIVYVESKFPGGKKVRAGKIIVTDSQGTELVNGTTNDKGEFSFRIPQKTDLKIVLLAGEGHRAEWKLPLSEIETPSHEKTAGARKRRQRNKDHYRHWLHPGPGRNCRLYP